MSSPTEYTLVLLRHGQSVWNLENVFTGWTDVELSRRGIAEATEAGATMAAAGIGFDVVHTSVLRRAIDTGSLALAAMELAWIPVHKHWRLNERHYGALQGENKRRMAEVHGADQVQAWRRSYDLAPPPLETEDPRHPSHDPRYAEMAPDSIPSAESLSDVVDRLLPYWYDQIVPDIRAMRRVLVAAHGNSLRALVKHLDGIPDDQITTLNIPTGIPLLYRLDANLRPIERVYLGDPDAAEAAAAAVAAEAG
ncbi:MAG: 2,3-diphosphoglycerate-dependent phosphoglycerate mutase [Acidobacteria bacterium]|nr:2,3-diphosphoglycerate-dependent phosphoglycerate mutase [Acidobacteriota bacterium]